MGELEQKMKEVEGAFLSDLRKVIRSEQPVIELERLVNDFNQTSNLLKTPDKCELYYHSLSLRTKLSATSASFEKKITESAAGKSTYSDMVRDIATMQRRLDALLSRLEIVGKRSRAIADDASESIKLYSDSLSITGEATAKKELIQSLQTQEQNLLEAANKSD